MSARSIKALCITEDPDRPTAATFVGLHTAGVDITVVCPPGRARTMLAEAGVRLLHLPPQSGRDRPGRLTLRAELDKGRYDILHAFGNRGVQNGLAAARGLPV